MGHATHFLERLERLSSPQADFALELYRDSALIRFVLERARLPDGAERVALGVDERPGGPHLIVARDGGFVTCLGAGMSIHDLPVISRGQIEHLGGQFDGMRAAVARSRDRGETRRLFRNLAEKGWALSREDFTALAVMMPILEFACARSATDIARYVTNCQRGFTRSRYRRMNDKAVAELRHYWASWWAVGHLVALCGTRGPELGAEIAKSSEEKAFMTHTLSRMTMYSMAVPVMLRGGWAAGRVGREVIPRAKQKMRMASDFTDVVCNAVPLAIMALRHRGVRAEISKFLVRTRRGLEQAMCTPIDQLLSESLLSYIESLFEPDGAAAAAEVHRRVGTSLALSVAGRLPEGHPCRYGSAEEVPDELALAFPMFLDADLLHDVSGSLVGLPMMLPWLAGAEAVDFYLPAELIDTYSAVWPPWSAESTLAQLDNLHRYYGRDRPARARVTTGRNEPCPCGSGKKYKRCCGA